MPNNLAILIIFSIIVFLFHVFKQIKKNQLNIKNALIWMLMSVCIIICIFQIDNITSLAKLVGIEKASNMIFFLGFIFLIFTTFNLTKTVSVQNRKIVKLTQELALLRKEIEKRDK